MSDIASSLYSAILANATQVSSHVSAAAQRGKDEEIQSILDARYEEEQRIIDEQNRVGLAEQKRVYGQRQAVAYRLSIAQMADARLQAREYELLSEDFLASAGMRRAQMGVAYSRSGALLAGSALARTSASKQRAEQGSERLKRAAKYAMSRGKMLSTITRHSAFKPSFVPVPDAIKQTHVPMPGQDTGSGRRFGAPRFSRYPGRGGATAEARALERQQALAYRTSAIEGSSFMKAFQEGGQHIPSVFGPGAGGRVDLTGEGYTDHGKRGAFDFSGPGAHGQGFGY